MPSSKSKPVPKRITVVPAWTRTRRATLNVAEPEVMVTGRAFVSPPSLCWVSVYLKEKRSEPVKTGMLLTSHD